MGWFNLGKQGRDGKQVRIEHRGRNLWVSRTGGISLRAQTKAAGLNLTANSQHGVRVSRSLARNTQMALQNGRLVLRGRYGSGPTKLNMSKSGLTFSSKNQLGTFNWVKPGRSSAKLFGVQVRGRKAANAHLAFMLVSLLVTMTATLLGMLLLLLQWLMALGGFCWRLLLQIPDRIQQSQQWFAERQLQRARAALPAAGVQQIAAWPAANQYAAVALAILGWGRGESASQAVPAITRLFPTGEPSTDSLASSADWVGVADALESLLSEEAFDSNRDRQLALLAEIGKAAAARIQLEELPALIMQLDELALLQADKTCLQERMIGVFCDAAGLRMVNSTGLH
ncbi:hypothetical protein SAMN05216198_0677 [Halopseudomonas litoralis]|uniref:Uncharacterized protein n=1 Tax=Halopseudomonas litoralis TaxID=797277 RepID=A0A1H1MNZ6_9GAMM|nr:hypothetical protein [Halopseudomonas litoralis]SDR88447.1 hypothetical protein SAMN05216198_0677 [Halopseudomonas litoralis]